MILRKKHQILVFGLTGKQGTFWGQAMIDYGAKVIAGVNPRKAGQIHLNRQIYASAMEARQDNKQFDVALLFVPPMAALTATIDACEAGAEIIICLAEHIPVHDVMEMISVAKTNGSILIGPNTAGMVTPGETFAGIMPAFNPKIFQPGEIGVISRSGSLGTLVCLNLVQRGLGQSAFYGIGGDPVIGTSTRDALFRFLDDQRTKAVVICGEIGGTSEEEAAELATETDKPVIAFIAGSSSPTGKKMGHAGAIVNGASGAYSSKRRKLEQCGVPVADLPSQIPNLVVELMAQRGINTGK